MEGKGNPMYDDGLEDSKSLAVYVSNHHIDKGDTGEVKSCALALAASEGIPEDWRADVFDIHVEFRRTGGLGDCCVRLGDPEKEFVKEFDIWGWYRDAYGSSSPLKRPNPRMLAIPLPDHVA